MIKYGLDEQVKQEFAACWTKGTSEKIRAAIARVLYETLGEGWKYCLPYKEIEHWLKVWEEWSDPENPHVQVFSALRFQMDRMVEDVTWEEKFQMSGGDEGAKAHAFGYDI